MKFVRRIIPFVVGCTIMLCSAPALAADEPTLQTWQGTMHTGCQLYNDNDFPGAQKQFESAIEIAKKLQKDEAQYLALLELSGALCAQAKYTEAEAALRTAASTQNGEGVYENLAPVLEKQGKYDEAKALLRKSYTSQAEAKAANAAMKGIQQAIKKQWTQHVKGIPATAWTVAVFRVPKRNGETIAYVCDGSNDVLLDRASVKALLKADLPTSIEGMKGSAIVRFTFNFNVFGGPDESPQHYGSTTFATYSHEYKIIRDRLATLEKVLGQDHPECVATMLEAANKLNMNKGTATAEVAYGRVIEICDAKGMNGTYLLRALSCYGDCLMKRKQYDEAQKVLDRAVKLKAEYFPADAYLQTDPTPLLAKALTKLHRADEAKQLLSATGTK